jgi:hypothetical protein
MSADAGIIAWGNLLDGFSNSGSVSIFKRQPTGAYAAIAFFFGPFIFRNMGRSIAVSPSGHLVAAGANTFESESSSVEVYVQDSSGNGFSFLQSLAPAVSNARLGYATVFQTETRLWASALGEEAVYLFVAAFSVAEGKLVLTRELRVARSPAKPGFGRTLAAFDTGLLIGHGNGYELVNPNTGTLLSDVSEPASVFTAANGVVIVTSAGQGSVVVADAAGTPFQTITPPAGVDSFNAARFGHSLAVAGDLLVIGATNDATGTGSPGALFVYAFDHSSSKYDYCSTIGGAGSGQELTFGFSVALQVDDSGAVTLATASPYKTLFGQPLVGVGHIFTSA